MIAIIATFTVPEANAAAFESVIAELSAATRANEPGVTLYQLVRGLKDPTHYRLMELYADQATVDTHMASDWFKAAGPKLGELIEGRPLLERYETVG